MTEQTNDAALGLAVSRTLAAPRELVYRMFTEPQHAAQWFAPPECAARCEMDVRPGGAYRIIIQVPGAEIPIKGVYLEVDPPARLVYTEDLSEHPAEWLAETEGKLRGLGGTLAAEYLVTVTFEERGAGTEVTLSYAFRDEAERAAHEQADWLAGYRLGLERLDAYLASLG
ncbi:MAG TPA: SRPBCC domain-containing protein [Herpetosiphonaceae bacterium]